VAASKSDKDAFALLSEYSKLYHMKYGQPPILNKYKEKWGMSSLVEDFGKDGVSRTLHYYFKLNRDGHALPWFYNNFSNIHLSRLASEKDDKIRAAARAKTRQLRAEHLNGLS
jgi:hypothetical protein